MMCRTFGLLLFLPFVAVAQAPIDVLRADIAELKSNVALLVEQSDIEAAFRVSQAAAMAELLSRQVAQTAPTKESAAQWVSGASQARTELTAAANAPEFLASAPPDVRMLAKDCVIAAASAQVSPQDNPGFTLPGCSEVKQQELKEKLRDLEISAQQAYDRCRRVILSRAPEYEDLVPRNAHDADAQLLHKLSSYPDADVRACQESLEDAHKQLKELKDAKAILSNAMMMAANICFASGGNPYVCGGMFALAILMEIFDGSGGGGNGDGPGEGPQEGGAGGGQSVLTVSGGPPSEAPSDKQARQARANEAVGRGPDENLGEAPVHAAGGANLGAAGTKSKVLCNGSSGRIRCSIDGVPESDRHFFGPALVTKLATQPVPGVIVACLNKRRDGTLEVAGIAIKDGNNFFAFAHNAQRGTQELGQGWSSFEAACSKIQ
jgi:hypothetical protein